MLILGATDCDCERKGYRYVIPAEKKEAAQGWVLDCASKSNPYSDEEPEDMIKQCEWTAERLFGDRLEIVEHVGLFINPYWEIVDGGSEDETDR